VVQITPSTFTAPAGPWPLLVERLNGRVLLAAALGWLGVGAAGPIRPMLGLPASAGNEAGCRCCAC